MIDPFTRTLWGWRTAYAGALLVLLLARLLPLSSGSGHWPGPDLPLAMTLVLVLRRPDFAPAPVIAGYFLLEDFLLLRPPGLWALIVLMGTEFLRRREHGLRDLPFLFDWALAAAVMAAMVLAQRFLLGLFMVPQAGLGPHVVYLLATMAAYPLVAGLLWLAPTLRRAAPGQTDEMGRLR